MLWTRKRATPSRASFGVALALAIGGIFDGDPDATTGFPQEIQVDYVSVSKLGGS